MLDDNRRLTAQSDDLRRQASAFVRDARDTSTNIARDSEHKVREADTIRQDAAQLALHMSNTHDTLKHSAEEKNKHAGNERDYVNIIAERDVIKLQQSHHSAQVAAEASYSTMEHASVAARTHVAATITQERKNTVH